MEAKKLHWYQHSWFVESNWVSSGTKWFLTFSGKLARIVLIASTLYMSAELYPGVSFPAQLNLAMFIVLSFALDMGGLGLAQIAKQVRRNGHREEARKGEILSKWLITIMVAGLVAVSLENALRSIKALSGYQSTIDVLFMVIDIALTIARVICAVSYGHVLNELEQSIEQTEQTEQANDALLLENRQQIEALSMHVQELVNHVQTMDTGIDTRIDNHIQQIQAELSVTVSEVKHSVSEVHNTVLQITQHNHYGQPYTGPGQAVENTIDAQEEPTFIDETSKSSPALPALHVPGVTQEKITEVLSIVLSGISWTKASQQAKMNYSRDVKRIKEAYEQAVYTA